jgi:subtilisin
MMRCMNCGSEIPEETRFCPWCGAEAEPAPETPETAPETAPESVPETVPESAAAPETAAEPAAAPESESAPEAEPESALQPEAEAEPEGAAQPEAEPETPAETPEAPAAPAEKPEPVWQRLWRRLRARRQNRKPLDREKLRHTLRVIGSVLTGLGLLALLVVALVLIHMNKEARELPAGEETLPQQARPEPINFYAQADPGRIRSEGQVQYVCDELLAVSAEGVSYTEMERFCSERGYRVVGYVELTDTYQLRLPEVHTLEGLERLAAELEQEDMVDCAMPNVAWAPGAFAIPEDPWGGQLNWEAAVPDTDNWGLMAIRAPESWALCAPGTLRIGILDGGFDSRHEDLRFASLHRNTGEGRGEGGEALLLREHGTMCASVLGAVQGNGLGLSGTAPDCALYAVGSKAWCGQMDALSAIAELSGENVKVICCGLGYREELAAAAAAGQPELQRWYYERPGRLSGLALRRLLGKGYDFLLVCPAGNSAELDAGWSGLFAAIAEPELRERILVVGAAGLQQDGSLVRASFSSGGERVDLLAPGVQVFCALPGNTYARRDGTSLAAAHAAGAAACAWALDPGMSGAQLRALLMETARTPVENSQVGLLNMQAALSQARSAGGRQDERERAREAYAALLSRGLRLRRLSGGSGAELDAQRYLLLDMDGDGAEELLVYALHESERSASFALYTCRGGEAVCIADAWETCRFSSWSNVSLTLEVWDGKNIYASAEKSSAGYGESGDCFWLSWDGKELKCLEEDRRPADGERTILIFNSAFTPAGVPIGSAEDELRER